MALLARSVLGVSSQRRRFVPVELADLTRGVSDKLAKSGGVSAPESAWPGVGSQMWFMGVSMSLNEAPLPLLLSGFGDYNRKKISLIRISTLVQNC
jgi:hypothetical protein